MSPGAPPHRYPHRLTVPVTALVFLLPWFAAGWFRAPGPTLVPVVPAAAADVIAAPVDVVDAPDVMRGSEPQDPEPLGVAPEVLAEVVVAPTPPPTNPPAEPEPEPEPVTGRMQAVVVAPAEPLAAGSPAADGMRDHEIIGQAALARIPFPWPERLPGWTVHFSPGDGPRRGQADPSNLRIDVWVGSADDVYSVAAVLAHEIGHAADFTLNDTGARRGWKALRGIPADAAWWPSGSGSDFATGAGDFAECFASWQLGAPNHSTWGPCSPAEMDHLISMVS